MNESIIAAIRAARADASNYLFALAKDRATVAAEVEQRQARLDAIDRLTAEKLVLIADYDAALGDEPETVDDEEPDA